MALTYADFYFQFKSTGFGNCLHAARCLVQKLNLPYSGKGFPQFVSVVKEVRNEIVEKNPRNRLTPSEFESAFAGWLWQERFRLEPVKCSPQESPSVNVITAKSSPSRVCSSDDSVVTDLLQQRPSNDQHSIDPYSHLPALSTDGSGSSTLDQPDTLPSTTDHQFDPNSSLDLKPSLTINFPPELVNHALNQADAAQAQIIASPPSADPSLWPLCSSVERQAPVSVDQQAPVSVERQAPVSVERLVPVSVERQSPVSVDTSIATKDEFDTSISTKTETCEEKFQGHENATIKKEDEVDSEQVMLEKAWIKKLKNDLREKLGVKVGKGKPLKEKAPPLTKEEKERQRLEAKLVRQADKERIKMEEKLKKQQEREKRREEEEMLKREEKARKRLARQEKKEKKVAEEKAERLRKKQARMERNEAKTVMAKLKRQEAKESRQDNEVRQAAIKGQQRIRTALTGQEGKEVTCEGNGSQEKKPCPLVGSVCEDEHDEKLKQDQGNKEMQRKEREKRQVERLKKKCELKQEQLKTEPTPAVKRKKTRQEQMVEEATWLIEGSFTARRKTRGSSKTFNEIAPDGDPEQMESCSDDDDDDLDVCWEAGESSLRRQTYKKRLKLPRPNIAPDEDGKFPCQAEGCESKFTVFRSVVVHMQNRHQLHLFSCADCEEKFKVADRLSYHGDVVHGCADNGACKCEVCGSCFSNADNLNRHNTLEHVPGTIQCLFCDRKFHYSEDRNKHIIVDHADVVFPCKACSKFFRQDSAAFGHFKTHHPDQIINCSGCKREFAAQRSFRYHVETSHYKLIEWETPFQCEVVTCQLRWSTQENLDRHKASKHRKATSQRCDQNPNPAPGPVPKVVCDTCGLLISRFKLARHMKKHFIEGRRAELGNGRNLEECKECGKLYANLRQHMMVVHRGRHFQCPQCEKEFRVPVALQSHIRATHEEKRYQCDECDKSYAYRCDMLKHSQATHMFSAEGNDRASVAPVGSPAQAPPAPPAKKPGAQRGPEWEKSDEKDEDDIDSDEEESDEDGESDDLEEFSEDEDDFDEMEEGEEVEGEEMEEDDEEMEEEENVDRRKDDETEDDNNVEDDEGGKSDMVKTGIDVEGKTDEAEGREEETLGMIKRR